MQKFFIVLCLASLVYSGYTVMFAEQPSYRNCAVTVTRGDSLWGIASKYTEADEDVRDVMLRIRKANKLQTTKIYPGQELVIPVRDK